MIGKIIFEWQGLIGAATPITFWFFTEWYKEYKSYKQNLKYLEKLLILNINKLEDTRNTIQRFIDQKLILIIDSIDERTRNGHYAVDTAFIPLYFVDSFEKEILERNWKSVYLETWLARTVVTSKDFALNMEDVRKQFDAAIATNKELALTKCNSVDAQNGFHKDAMQNFKTMLENEVLGNNIKIYMRYLLMTLATVQIIQKIGFVVWYFKFSPSFRFFKNKKALQAYINQAHERIEKYVENQILTKNDEIKELYLKSKKLTLKMDA